MIIEKDTLRGSILEKDDNEESMSTICESRPTKNSWIHLNIVQCDSTASDVENVNMDKAESLVQSEIENHKFCDIEDENERNNAHLEDDESSYVQKIEMGIRKSVIDDSDEDDIIKRHSSNPLQISDDEETVVETNAFDCSERLEHKVAAEIIGRVPLLKNNDLFDTEEDDNVSEAKAESNSEENIFSKESVPITKPKTLKSQRLLKEEKQKIYSESQRMMRESQVSLPHHKPKQMTLSDFLNRKKNVPPTIKIAPEKFNSPTITSTTSDMQGPATDSPSLFFEDSSHPLATNSIINDDSDSELPALRLQDSETIDVPSESAHDEEMNNHSSNVLNIDDDCAPSTSGSGNVTLKSLKSDILKSMKMFTPKLNANSVIDLNSDDFAVRPSGLDDLIERFVRHSHKRKPKDERKLSLSIVQKETDDTGNVTLKQNHVTVMAPAEEYVDLSEQTPGSKLLNLKEALRAKMSSKKEKLRQKRLQLHELDNENFDNDDEEAVMTDESENDKENEKNSNDEFVDMDQDIRKELFDEEAEESEKELVSDDEAEKSEKECMSEENDDEKIVADIEDGKDAIEDEQGDKSINHTQATLILDSDDDSHDVILSKKKRKSAVIEDDDGDESENDTRNNQTYEIDQNKSLCATSILESGKDVNDLNVSLMGTNSQCERDRAADTSFELQGSMLPPYQMPRSISENSFSSTCTQKSTYSMLPAEDSQSFFRNDSYGTTISDRNNSFHFFSENSSDTKESSCKRSLFLEEDSQSITTGDGMSELLGLCSGKFTEKGSLSVLNMQQQESTQDNNQNMDELLGLCSGRFNEKDISNPEEAENNHPLKLVTSDAVLSEDEDSNDLQLSFANENEESEEDEIDEYTGKRGRAQFLEDEAELSGSEAESDEDLDIAEEDDVLDEELGDQDALPSEDELRDQVGKVHFKTMLDQDKKELRLYQEMYLEDGDLHGDGETRARSFRWRNAGNEENDDHVYNNSDEEIDDQEDEANSQWRMQRLEREKWMQEKKMEFLKDDEEFNFSHKMKKPEDFINENSDINGIESTERQLSYSESFSDSILIKNVKGSFLSRKRKSLEKIEQFSVKGKKENMNGANQASKNFVFATLSQVENKIMPSDEKITIKSVSNGTTIKKAKLGLKSSNSVPQLKRSSSLFSYL